MQARLARAVQHDWPADEIAALRREYRITRAQEWVEQAQAELAAAVSDA